MEELLLRVLERKRFELDDKKTDAERLENFYAALGYGGVTLQSYLPLLREEYQKLLRCQQEDPVIKKVTSDKGVIVEGIDNCTVKFAQCCHPLPGDPVVGYITRSSPRGGGGITIHHQSCENVPRDILRAPEPDRWLRARWDSSEKSSYCGALTIQTVNQRGMTAAVSALLNNLHVDIDEFSSHNNKDGTGTIRAIIGVGSREQLKSIRGKILQIKGVTDVEL
jgi:GTP pyrophosphokinase